MASVNIVQGTTPVVKVTGSSVPAIKVTNPTVNVVKVVGGTISFENTTIPQAPSGGLEYQFLTSENNVAAWDYVQNIFVEVENGDIASLAEGTPVYALGLSGNRITVAKAEANTSSKMPCIGILYQTLAVGAHGYAVTAGIYKKTISGLSGVSVGDTIYVGSNGGVTTTKPSHPDLIQNIGVVLKTNGSNIQKMKVSAIDRVNDVPNITQGKFLIGGSSYAEESAYTMPTSDGSANQYLKTDGSGAVSFNQIAYSEISGTPTLPGSVNGQILVGGTSGVTLGTITAGDGVTVTNGDGSITISSAVLDTNTNIGNTNLDIPDSTTRTLDLGSTSNLKIRSEGSARNRFLIESVHSAGSDMFEVSTDGSANNYTTDAYGALSVRPDPSSSQTREFRWYNTANSAYVSLKSQGPMSSSYDLTWPRTAPPGDNYILQADSNGDFGWLATPSSGTDNTLNANITDVLSLSTQEINAVDATADKLVFWDDSASKLTYANLGTNLTFTGATLDATGSGGISNVVEDTTPQLGGNLDTNNNNINFGDADEAVFGDDSDLKIYHAGGGINHIYGVGSTYITGGTDLYLRGVNGEEAVTINGNGSVELFHDNVKKVETKSTGVDVEGRVSADAIDIEYSTTLAAAGNYAEGSKVSYNFGTTTSGMTRGDVYYFNGGWVQSDADAVSSASKLLAVAVGTSSTSGMVLSGIVRVHDSTGFSSASEGDVLYLDTDAGHVTSDISSHTTGDVVRVVGYVIDVTNKIIYFDPSSDWIELS